MELISLVLSLRPLSLPENPAATPKWWGRAAHALLLNVIRQRDEALANQLHLIPNSQSQIENPNSQIQNPIRPFTVSTLMGRFAKGALIADETYVLRLTAFSPEVAQILGAESLAGRLSRGQIIELDYQRFEILSVQPNPQSQIENPKSIWASQTTYRELSAPFLLPKADAPRRLAFHLTSPTTFKSGGRHFPVPAPALVFGSLLERWNAFAPVAFPNEVKRYAEECMAVSKYDLKTKPVPQKDAGLRVGAIGKVTFATVNYDRYWMSVLATLAEFALFCGVGAGTAQGLGQARRVEN